MSTGVRQALASLQQVSRPRIPLSRPDITDLERTAVTAVLESPSLSLGPKLVEFENAFAAYLKVPFAIAVNSGTSALHLCAKAAGIGPGDEVITSPFSFVASANCIQFERGRPVFVDIDADTLNIDTARISAAISARTKAILPVHVFGRPCDMSTVMQIAGAKGLAVIEDSCEAIGATTEGRFAGTFGDTGTFAFYPNKQMTTGEGGMIVTSSEEIAASCRRWRNQGRGASKSWLQHETLGYNYRLSDINCALGIAQLYRLDGMLEKRANVARKYTELLKKSVPEIIPPSPESSSQRISWFVYVIRLREEFSFEDRNEVLRQLNEHGIDCSNYFTPIHLQPFYREQFGYAPGDFPVCEQVSARTIALPFFNSLSDEEIEFVCSTLATVLTSIRRARTFAVSNAKRKANYEWTQESV
jgi:perosamine synthetase